MAMKVKRFEVRIELDRWERYREHFEEAKRAHPDLKFVDWIRAALDRYATEGRYR
jgi:hypothetical protein